MHQAATECEECRDGGGATHAARQHYDNPKLASRTRGVSPDVRRSSRLPGWRYAAAFLGMSVIEDAPARIPLLSAYGSCWVRFISPSTGELASPEG
jgi:hypothetical protein